MSYQDVKDRLYHGHRKIANNTYLRYENEFHGDRVTHPICMRLHGNVVARFYPDHLELYSAGWYTTTTKNRLNMALQELANIDNAVFQKDRVWYVDCPQQDPVPFIDGMRVPYGGL